eukprot:CAMPEP_0182863502 /NCGR_PEP_ID=MMETSP0034_2-20130328/6674_1 /TAXON_ID=156128 /ORGANISM="Nephroselmis pyriformis, Strain CCMP717" /LENGTH=84 /DNA_ID=CAMNT_0024995713 /DNA_START=1184 /DNA_END=1438 /DNA_ORIENTATION=+
MMIIWNCMGVRMLKHFGKNAYGIELSPDSVRTFCPDLEQKGFVQVGSLAELPFESDSFDAVLSGDVLEHIPEYANALVHCLNTT